MRSIPLHSGKISAAEQERVERERAILTAQTPLERSYRVVNGLGVEYRVEAVSAIAALGLLKAKFRISPLSTKLQVVEDGCWVWVL